MKKPTEDVMPRVDGKPFRCECGCNVFRWVKPADRGPRLRCNSCRELYEAGKPPPDVAAKLAAKPKNAFLKVPPFPVYKLGDRVYVYAGHELPEWGYKTEWAPSSCGTRLTFATGRVINSIPSGSGKPARYQVKHDSDGKAAWYDTHELYLFPRPECPTPKAQVGATLSVRVSYDPAKTNLEELVKLADSLFAVRQDRQLYGYPTFGHFVVTEPE